MFAEQFQMLSHIWLMIVEVLENHKTLTATLISRCHFSNRCMEDCGKEFRIPRKHLSTSHETSGNELGYVQKSKGC